MSDEVVKTEEQTADTSTAAVETPAAELSSIKNSALSDAADKAESATIEGTPSDSAADAPAAE
jgi:hypothetical protein